MAAAVTAKTRGATHLSGRASCFQVSLAGTKPHRPYAGLVDSLACINCCLEAGADSCCVSAPRRWRQRDESQGQGLAGLEPAGADPPYPALDYEHGPRPVVGVAAAPSLESSSAPRQPRRRRPSPAAGDAPHGINAPRVRSQPLPRVSGVQVAVTAAGAELLDAGPSSLPSGSLLSGDAFRSGGAWL